VYAYLALRKWCIEKNAATIIETKSFIFYACELKDILINNSPQSLGNQEKMRMWVILKSPKIDDLLHSGS